jgi:uracil-DNA glycosylase
MKDEWQDVQDGIEACLECSRRGYSQVLCHGPKKHPTVEPRNVKVLFISEAPPASGTYIYDETRPDILRGNLFTLLKEIGLDVNTVRDFLNYGFFLVPTVKCPSGKRRSDRKSMNNDNPKSAVIRICTDLHLRREIAFIKPRRIVLLGGVALRGCSLVVFGLDNRRVEDARQKSPISAKLDGAMFEVFPTYWPTPRWGHFEEMKGDLRRAFV